MDQAKLLTGSVSIDDRGEVGYVNDFDFAGVKRFYTVTNHRQGFVRAWHAHKNEAKYTTVVAGAALIASVAIDDWEQPSKTLKVHRYVISARKPAVLFIPAGYANGFMSLSEDTKVMFFSTSTLEQSTGDDIRFDSRYWDPWTVEER